MLDIAISFDTCDALGFSLGGVVAGALVTGCIGYGVCKQLPRIFDNLEDRAFEYGKGKMDRGVNWIHAQGEGLAEFGREKLEEVTTGGEALGARLKELYKGNDTPTILDMVRVVAFNSHRGDYIAIVVKSLVRAVVHLSSWLFYTVIRRVESANANFGRFNLDLGGVSVGIAGVLSPDYARKIAILLAQDLIAQRAKAVVGLENRNIVVANRKGG